jgi:hypothetical protein
MSLRVLKLLALSCTILLLAWLASLYRQVPHNKSPYAKAVDAAQSIQLQQVDSRIYLRKEKQAWTVSTSTAGPFYAVDEDRLHTLTSGLQDLQLEDVISEHPRNADDFAVDTLGIRVTLRAGQGKVLADGIFGKQAEDATHIYFRYADQPAVYLARGLLRGELGGADLTGWRNHALVSMSEDQIQTVHIQTQGDQALLQKSSETWTVNGAPADTAKVKTWLGAAAHLLADDFAAPASTTAPKAADLRAAVIMIKDANSSVTLSIGALDAKNKRFPVSTGAENGVAWIAAPRMQALLLKSADFKSK